jgi:uncharacterized protein YbjQ (UPF0145 family)
MVKSEMIITTTTQVQGIEVRAYLGVVAGEAVMGINMFRDMFASVRNIVGGRAAGYEKALAQGRKTALDEMAVQAENIGADAVIGVSLDYEDVGGMMLVCATGTAVQLA